MTNTKTPYADVVRHEAQDLLEKTESAVFYHDLAELNLPYSITDFAARAHTHGLGFLAEAEYHDSSGASLPDHTAASLAQLAAGDVIRREQYLDYLKGRRFRQTLLCRQEVAIVRPAQADAVLQMQATGHLYEDAAFADTDIGKAHPGLRRFCASGGAASHHAEYIGRQCIDRHWQRVSLRSGRSTHWRGNTSGNNPGWRQPA